MTDLEAVATLRSFHRTLTERIGALEDHYLARARPLGASRVLWEIRPDGADIGAVRERLGLDSGYLSRLLRSLEREGLATVAADARDGRRRIARLTPAGAAEREVLDRESDALAASLLDPLSPAQRARLAAAAAEVERLLTAGLVTVGVEDPATPAARHCIARYFEELDERFERGFDPAISISADVDELTEPSGLLLVARLRGEPVGCGALKLHGTAPAELKRMWVAPSARGLGLGRRLLVELEERARRRGCTTVRLETNRNLGEAISLYRSAGYEEVEAFNDEPFAHHWFEKHLDRTLTPVTNIETGTNPRVRITNVELLSDNWYTLRRVDYDYLDSAGRWTGQRREAYDRGNGATVLLVDWDRRTVLLTRQFRLPAYVNGHPDGMLIETAGGLLDGDDPAEAVRREAEEETGCRIRSVRPLFELFMSPGSVTERVAFFVAEYLPSDRIAGGGGLDEEGEDIEVIELGLETAFAMVARGEIVDGKTVLLLQWAQLNG